MCPQGCGGSSPPFGTTECKYLKERPDVMAAWGDCSSWASKDYC